MFPIATSNFILFLAKSRYFAILRGMHLLLASNSEIPNLPCYISNILCGDQSKSELAVLRIQFAFVMGIHITNARLPSKHSLYGYTSDYEAASYPSYLNCLSSFTFLSPFHILMTFCHKLYTFLQPPSFLPNHVKDTYDKLLRIYVTKIDILLLWWV